MLLLVCAVLTAISGTGLPDYRVVYQHNHEWTKTNMNTIHGRFYSKNAVSTGAANDCFL